VSILVQKYGGKCLSTPHQRVECARCVLGAVRAGRKVVVVVSAMGRAGAPYATDTLMELAAREWPPLLPRELDLMLACGEIISAALFAHTLRSLGLEKVRALTGAQAGLITSASYGRARIVRVNTDSLHELLKDNWVPVVAGFQGITKSGEVTTLGRGGSDITATALAAALKASLVEIYTHAGGVRTADPDLVPQARPVPALSYWEAWHLAAAGMRVLHPDSILQAARSRIPLVVRDPQGRCARTLVTDGANLARPGSPAPVTGIAHRLDIRQLQLRPSGQACAPTFPLTVAYPVETGVAPRHSPAPYGAVTLVGAGTGQDPQVLVEAYQALLRAGISPLQCQPAPMRVSFITRREDTARAVRILHDHFRLAGADGTHAGRDEGTNQAAQG